MRILLLGKNGQVGWELQRSLAPLGDVTALGHAELDLEDVDALRQCVRQNQPHVIVNAAAYTAVDKAESDAQRAHRINAEAPGVIAEEAARMDAWLVHYSTDYVFDGESTTPYREDAATRPLSVYGTTKLEGERLIHASHSRHLIFRTSWVYAARGSNFAKTILRLAQERDELDIVSDQYGAPTSAELIADVTALVLHRVTRENASQSPGTYHLAAAGCTSWHGYAQYLLELAQGRLPIKAGPGQVHAISTETYPLPAKRPKNARLDTGKLVNTFELHLPDWRYHLRRLIDELAPQGKA